MFFAVTLTAVVYGGMRTFGPDFSLFYARIGFPSTVFALQVWQLRKFGPKGLGLVALLAMVFVKLIYWTTDSPFDDRVFSSFLAHLCAVLTVSLVVTWLYTSIRAVMTRASPNCEMGLLSLLWIIDPGMLLLFDEFQCNLCSTWEWHGRPFGVLFKVLWSSMWTGPP
jgi:hypothetical protein